MSFPEAACVFFQAYLKASILVKDCATATAVVFLIDRFLYWIDASSRLLRIARALHRLHPGAPISPQVLIRQARLAANAGTALLPQLQPRQPLLGTGHRVPRRQRHTHSAIFPKALPAPSPLEPSRLLSLAQRGRCKGFQSQKQERKL